MSSYSINCIVDVRNIPSVKYAAQYNREYLDSELKQKGIRYLFMGDSLEAKYDAWKTEIFKSGVQRIIEELKNGAAIAIMCTDKEPFNCHRFALVSHALSSQGVKVSHILKNGTLCSNDDMENRLLEKYHTDYEHSASYQQLTAKQEALEKAYSAQSKELTCDSK
ncbi:MAG: DUF488 domain-containing protein [Deltaproteobacteria bacterium]|nr:DUF488 domain-containing protein [Deltaproteobacteria bacterium]